MGNDRHLNHAIFSENWLKEIDIAVTLCDKSGKIVYMNDKSVKTFINEGGENLIGSNVLDCHPEPSRSLLSEMLLNETKNAYTVTKGGVKKMILQIPYNLKGEYSGFAEFSFEIPENLKHISRD
jgi:transcriptional regulator with PAS, ATPase and Fis domain